MLLQNKCAVVYGAGGAVGGAVARAFAREGAKVYLAGRTLATLETVAAAIASEGGRAEVAQVDALNADSIERFLDVVERQNGCIDISFNAISLDDVQGTALVEMPLADFTTPIFRAAQTQFLTATAAARHMAKHRAGVILAITAQVARAPYPRVGGFGVAGAAIEAFCRQLAAEVGPQGIRVVCIESAGSPDSPGLAEVLQVQAEQSGVSRAEVEEAFAQSSMLKRLPRLAEVANMAVIMASEYASAVTAAVANVTCGQIAN